MTEKIQGFWVELILAFKKYDESFIAGYKTVLTWITLIVMAMVVYFLPENKLAYYVQLAGMGHLFVISMAKAVNLKR